MKEFFLLGNNPMGFQEILLKLLQIGLEETQQLLQIAAKDFS